MLCSDTHQSVPLFPSAVHLPSKDIPLPLDMCSAVYFCVLFGVLCDHRFFGLGIQLAWNGSYLA